MHNFAQGGGGAIQPAAPTCAALLRGVHAGLGAFLAGHGVHGEGGSRCFAHLTLRLENTVSPVSVHARLGALLADGRLHGSNAGAGGRHKVHARASSFWMQA
eukprot:scaffold102918_cov19-Tisochrysis_lutea.AAC.1